MIRTVAVLCSLLLLASCVGPLPGAREPAEAPIALPARAGLQCPPDLVIGEATSLAFPGIGARGQRGPAIAHGDGVYLLVWQEGFSGQGGWGDLWSSSANPGWSDAAFNADFVADGVSPGGYGNRNVGFGVRCLLN